jgi:hypothetical protein
VPDEPVADALDRVDGTDVARVARHLVEELDHGLLVRHCHVRAHGSERAQPPHRVAQQRGFDRPRQVRPVERDAPEPDVVDDGRQRVLERPPEDPYEARPASHEHPSAS